MRDHARVRVSGVRRTAVLPSAAGRRPSRPACANTQVTMEPLMTHYLLQFNYTSAAWAALTRQPTDRGAAIQALCEANGGRLVGAYYSFAEYDGVVLLEAPTHAAASTIAVTALAQGHIQRYTMAPLLTMPEALEVMRVAGQMSYSAPA